MQKKSVLTIVAAAAVGLSGALFAQTAPAQVFNDGLISALPHPKCDPIECNIKIKIADLPHPKCDPIECNIKIQ